MNRRTWIASVSATLLASRLRARADSDRGARAVILDHAGLMPVAISFRWKSEVVPNALATKAASNRHILANESVFAFTLTGTAGGKSTVLRHKATALRRFYDPALNMYTTSPVRGAELDRLLDPSSTFTLDLSFTYSTFFDVLLAQMTRTDDDLHNFAHPNDPAAILRTFEREERDGEVEITYKAKTHNIRGVPCKLIAVDVTPQASPLPPAVKLVFEIDFQTDIDAARRKAMRRLVAMDWSGLARHGKNSAPLPAHVELWRANVLAFLANQTDMRRAERIRTSMASRHAGKSPRKLASDLRDDIDRHVITGNHWTQLREDPRTERYQALVAELLGQLHQTVSPASPIYLNRELVKRYRLDLDQQVALTLQYGTGYCGEHSRTSFSILRTIMAAPGNPFDSIVLCGNANVDHGFVLCNLKVTRVIVTTATNPVNSRVSPGEDIKVFNLRDALAESAGREVLVVDPYLDRSMIASTGERLLRSLHSKAKRAGGKDTDFLLFEFQHPEPADFAIEDIRGRDVAERQALVKNV